MCHFIVIGYLCNREPCLIIICITIIIKCVDSLESVSGRGVVQVERQYMIDDLLSLICYILLTAKTVGECINSW